MAIALEIRHLRDLSTRAVATGRWDLAVVIDVIRAFTAAPWVLRQGAAALLLSPDTKTALTARREEHPGAILLKDGAPDPRFGLPNAPGRIAVEDLTGQTVIQTTGNGTRGAHLVRDVPTVLGASFATAAATARVIRRHRDVLLVPTEGDEDVALAEYLLLTVTHEAAPDPQPFLERVATSAAGRECRQRGVDPRYPGVHHDDLRLCQQIDTFDRALRLRPAGRLLGVDPV